MVKWAKWRTWKVIPVGILGLLNVVKGEGFSNFLLKFVEPKDVYGILNIVNQWISEWQKTKLVKEPKRSWGEERYQGKRSSLLIDCCERWVVFQLFIEICGAPRWSMVGGAGNYLTQLVINRPQLPPNYGPIHQANIIINLRHYYYYTPAHKELLNTCTVYTVESL